MTSVPLAMSDGKAMLPHNAAARALCEKGDRGIGTGDHDGAVESYERSLVIERSSYGLLGAAIARYFREDYREARVHFEEVLVELPGLKNVETMLADCVKRAAS